jgi:hypothetical protein
MSPSAKPTEGAFVPIATNVLSVLSQEEQHLSLTSQGGSLLVEACSACIQVRRDDTAQ